MWRGNRCRHRYTVQNDPRQLLGSNYHDLDLELTFLSWDTLTTVPLVLVFITITTYNLKHRYKRLDYLSLFEGAVFTLPKPNMLSCSVHESQKVIHMSASWSRSYNQWPLFGLIRHGRWEEVYLHVSLSASASGLGVSRGCRSAPQLCEQLSQIRLYVIKSHMKRMKITGAEGRKMCVIWLSAHCIRQYKTV